MRNTIRELSDRLPLRGLLSLPYGHDRQERWPLLVFLHGNYEAAPTRLHEGLTRYGPLRSNNNPVATQEFVVLAPQLPRSGDLWRRFGLQLTMMIDDVEHDSRIDPDRVYLTGLGYGANGVFDLALSSTAPWAALWPVDPTREPLADPKVPIWLSSGPASRAAARQFGARLKLQPPGTVPGHRIYADDGLDHVSTAAIAYANARVYRWLLRYSRRHALALASRTAHSDVL